MPNRNHSPFSRQKPPDGAQIDWGHPLSANLEAAWGCTVGAATTDRIRDLVRKGWGDLITTNAPVPQGGRFGGYAPYFSANTKSTISANTFRDLGGMYSWVIWFKADAVPNSGFERQPVHQQTQETTGFSWSHTVVGFRQAVFHRDNAGTYVPAKIVSAVAAQVWYQIAAVYDGVNINAYLNGQREAFAAANPGSATAFNIEMQRASEAEVGVVDHMLLWNRRALSPQDILQLYNEPFAFLRGPGRSSGKVAA